jgi:Ca2+-binding RTX toxin-like protein
MASPPYYAYDLFGPNQWAPLGGLWSSGTITISPNATPGSSILIGFYFGYLGPSYGGAFYPGLEYHYFNVGTANATLFTTGNDIVKFNNLSAEQVTAINAAPTQLYNALGGNDTIVLPSEDSSGNYVLSPAVNATRNPNQTFTVGATTDTSSNADSVTGGNGNYNIAIIGPAAANVTINGNGSSNITAGSGTDTITITGDGNNTITAGSGTDTITIKGNGSNTVTGGPGTDTINLSGSGNSTVTGGTGIDTVTITGNGTNTINGGTGFDYINVTGMARP